MTTDYRLWHISTLQDLDVSWSVYWMQREGSIAVDNDSDDDNSKSAQCINAVYMDIYVYSWVLKGSGFGRGHTWQEAR